MEKYEYKLIAIKGEVWSWSNESTQEGNFQYSKFSEVLTAFGMQGWQVDKVYLDFGSDTCFLLKRKAF